MPEASPVLADLPAADRAYVYTKDLVVRGELPGGTLLSEGRICDELGISRTPVHEAFLRLAAERLITLASRRGAVVAAITPNEAQDVLELREAVEGAAARRLVANGVTSTVLDRLHTLIDEQRAALAAGDLDAFVAADDGLHRTVVTASGNAIADHVIGLINDRQQRLRYTYLGVRPEHLEGSYADHRALVQHLADGDAEAYVTLLRDHVVRYRGVL